MRLRVVLVSVGALAIAGAAFVSGASGQEPPPPSAGSRLASGLVSTQGATIGPDGALYVTQGGTGGDTDVTPPDAPEGETLSFGLTAQISRIDPATGAVTVAADGLPSFGFGEEGAGGLADVAFLGSDMYFLLTGSPGETGDVDYPNGIYEVRNNGDITLIADIGAFNDANPVAFPDAGPGGNPFGLDVRSGRFIVTDGNYNRVLLADTDGDISILASFDNVVPTGLDTRTDGPVYVAWFSAFPHAPEDSKIVTVAYTAGTVAEVAGGFAQIIDVEFGPDGRLYALQFGDQQLDENAPPPPGRLLVLEDGELLPLVTGLNAGTSLDFSGTTAYVTTLFGEVWQIANATSLEPIAEPTPVAPQPTSVAPQPTATRATGVTAPDTGTGGYDRSGGGSAWLFILLVGGTVAVAAGAGLQLKRR